MTETGCVSNRLRGAKMTDRVVSHVSFIPNQAVDFAVAETAV